MIDLTLGVLIGLAAGLLSGLFGVGGGIVMAPGIHLLLGASPIVALATPLPAILPTALTGALTYRRAGEIDLRAAGLMIVTGLAGSAIGAALTEIVDARLLLLVTASLLAWQAIGLVRGRRQPDTGPERVRTAPLLLIGLAAGLASGLLGIGGGILMVPLLSGWLGMPLKIVLGTSLAAIVALVLPGAVVHAVLGNIDVVICISLIVGSVPGASIGARLALGVRERTLRIWVGWFMLLVAVLFAARQLTALFAG